MQPAFPTHHNCLATPIMIKENLLQYFHAMVTAIRHPHAAHPLVWQSQHTKPAQIISRRDTKTVCTSKIKSSICRQNTKKRIYHLPPKSMICFPMQLAVITNFAVLNFDQEFQVQFPARSHFWFGCGVPFILARSLRNGTKNTGGPLCVCTPHMQSKDPSLPLHKKEPIFWFHFLYSTENNSLCIEDGNL